MENKYYNVDGELNVGQDPIVVIGDINDKHQVCIAIIFEHDWFRIEYWYDGIRVNSFREKIDPKLMKQIKNLPIIPNSWKKKDMEYVVNKADKFIKKCRI